MTDTFRGFKRPDWWQGPWPPEPLPPTQTRSVHDPAHAPGGIVADVLWRQLADDLSNGDAERAALVIAASAGPYEARVQAAALVRSMLDSGGPFHTRDQLRELGATANAGPWQLILARLAAVIDPAHCTREVRARWHNAVRDEVGLPTGPPRASSPPRRSRRSSRRRR